LHLQVTDGGASWLLRYEIADTRPNPKSKRGRRDRWMGLGSFKDFSLKEARVRAKAKRQLLADDIDPLKQKADDKTAKAIAAAKEISFEKAARQYFDEHQSEWRNAKHRAQFISSLETFAFPVIGSLPIASIDKTLVLKVLEQPYEGNGAKQQRLWDAVPETASRLRGRMERVLGWDAVRNERKGENPARWKGHLEHVLKARKTVKHHAALSYNDVGEFFAELKQHNNKSALALEFTILTAARSNEVLGAKWDEIELLAVPVTTRDEEGHESTVMGPCWIVPGDRMKGFKRHRIPLSDRAVEILKAVCEGKFLASNSLVFDGLSDLAMWTLLTKQMGREVTIHGMRSTFRDWAGDIAHYPPEAAEKALAHGIKNKSEAAYWRSDMFDKRRLLMNDWARYCEMPKRSGDVVPIRKAGG
jgi:integrase